MFYINKCLWRYNWSYKITLITAKGHQMSLNNELQRIGNGYMQKSGISLK